MQIRPAPYTTYVRQPTAKLRIRRHTAVIFSGLKVQAAQDTKENVVANIIGAGLLGLPVFVMGGLLALSLVV